MASTKTPAKRAAKPAPKATEEEVPSDVRVIERYDDDTVRAELFGEEEFNFHGQTNDWIMFLAASGEITAIVKLLHSLILIDPDADDLEAERFSEKRRFDELLSNRVDLPTERIMRLYTDILAAVGNDQPESSSD